MLLKSVDIFRKKVFVLFTLLAMVLTIFVPLFTAKADAAPAPGDVPVFNKSFGETDPASFNGKFRYPYGIAADANGNIYVADTYNDRIQKFDSAGMYLSQWGTGGSGNSEFSYPQGIAADANGNIYVADSNNSRIQKFTYAPNTSTKPIVNPDGSPAGTNAVLTTGAYADITCHSDATESSLAVRDSGKDYPLGLVDFCLSVPSGSTQKIDLLFETDLTPSDVVARKYNSVTKTYADVPGATITEETISSKHYLRLTYSITDGGALDEDGVVNGEILDPVGLATAPIAPSDTTNPGITNPPGSNGSTGSTSALGSLANTGSNPFFLVSFATGLLLVGLVLRRKVNSRLKHKPVILSEDKVQVGGSLRFLDSARNDVCSRNDYTRSE